MRGKDASVAFARLAIGITPAHAGKREQDRARKDVRKDHPRPCGEKFIDKKPQSGGSGSPPPMRGKDVYSAQPERH